MILRGINAVVSRIMFQNKSVASVVQRANNLIQCPLDIIIRFLDDRDRGFSNIIRGHDLTEKLGRTTCTFRQERKEFLDSPQRTSLEHKHKYKCWLNSFKKRST